MAERRRRVSLLAGLGIAVWLLLTVASGVDRISAQRDGFAGWVPRAIEVDALARLGEKALAEGRTADALALAEAAVRRDPLAPTSTALLGAARLASKDASGAHRAFVVAGRLGWRVPLTQLYLYQNALDNDDVARAALRLDAVLRVQPDLAHDGALTGPIEATETGRAALADRLALRPAWSASYLSDAGDLPAQRLLLRSAVLAEFAGRHGPLGCAAIAPVAGSLDAKGLGEHAKRLRQLHCRTGRHGLFD